MANKIIYIPNDGKQNYPFVNYNQRFKLLATQLTNQLKLFKVPKVDKPPNKKTLLLYYFGD